MKLRTILLTAGLATGFGVTIANAETITVQKGDTLWGYGEKYDIPYQQIMKANGLHSDLIVVGQTLNIPSNTNKSNVSNSVKQNNSQYEVNLLARLVEAEANGEHLSGKIAVAAVVMNRVKSNSFPNTISNVIYQPGQFDPVTNGSINNQPNSESYTAAREALNGNDPTNGALYFYNPYVTSDPWLKSRHVTAVIGNHIFAR